MQNLVNKYPILLIDIEFEFGKDNELLTQKLKLMKSGHTPSKEETYLNVILEKLNKIVTIGETIVI